MRRLALLGCLAVAACTAQAKPDGRQPIASQITVTDGDTIKLRGERIRISNIDAPELPPHSKCWAEAALSLQASRELEWLIASARTVEVQREGVDRYGRTLARLRYNGDKDVGEALVNIGVAAKWTGRRWDWCASPDYANTNGPAMIAGPEENQSYTEWLAKNEGDALKRDLGPMNGGPWSVRATGPDRPATVAR